MTMTQTAATFFDTIETGKGWAACAPFCTPDATFSCQADALAGITTIEAYAGWIQGLLKPVADGDYEMKAFAADEARATVLGFAVFHGTHTADGGPVPPTGRTVAADYVYAMTFRDGRISHMTKIWNDGHSLRALGWA
jgi:ketosteroid isomerase-like protein